MKKANVYFKKNYSRLEEENVNLEPTFTTENKSTVVESKIGRGVSLSSMCLA